MWSLQGFGFPVETREVSTLFSAAKFWTSKISPVSETRRKPGSNIRQNQTNWESVFSCPGTPARYKGVNDPHPHTGRWFPLASVCPFETPLYSKNVKFGKCMSTTSMEVIITGNPKPTGALHNIAQALQSQLFPHDFLLSRTIWYWSMTIQN